MARTWLEFHPIANIFPLMEGEDFKGFCEDIKARGLSEPIVVHEGKVLDGRNRQNGCKETGCTPRYEQLPDGADPVAFVISKNLRRRHLNESQRAMVAANLAILPVGNPGFPIPSIDGIGKNIGISTKKAAESLNVGASSVERAKKVKDKGIPELESAVCDGTIPVSTAAEVAGMRTSRQQAIVDHFKGGDKKAAKEEIKRGREEKPKSEGKPKKSGEKTAKEAVKECESHIGFITRLTDPFTGSSKHAKAFLESVAEANKLLFQWKKHA